MSATSPLPQGQIELYLARLRHQLAGLAAEDVEEILRELRSHIAERAAESDSGEARTSIARILQELGTPEQIASLYRADAEVVQARASFSPALLMRTTLRRATKTVLGFVTFLAGVLGYALAVSFIGCAILKPIFPADVGLWINPHGFALGAELPRPHGHELLGWWIIPYGLVLGAAFLLGTTVVLRWMLRFVPKASQRVASLAWHTGR